MLFQSGFLERIRDGSVTLAFRRWRRPSVKAGGTLLTAIGQLQIGDVAVVSIGSISADDARRAGYESREALLAELNLRREGSVYRVGLTGVRPDPRVALRQRSANAGDLQDLTMRLARMDARSEEGPWTRRVLELLQAQPGVRAGDLCRMVRQEKLPFKLNVRKLKALGLTESLVVGYRLSPRGEAVLNHLRRSS